MRKLYGLVLACLLAVTSVVMGGGTAQAATRAEVLHGRCQIPGSDFVFRYDINYTRDINPDLGDSFTINNVKVTDAAGGHWMQSVYWEAEFGGTRYMWGSGSWAGKTTKWPKVGRAGTVDEWWAPWWRVTVKLTAYNNAGYRTPTCESPNPDSISTW